MHGLYKVSACVPRQITADAAYNAEQMLMLAEIAEKSGSAVAVFPELCITGAECGNLFKNSDLLEKSLAAAEKIINAGKGKRLTVIFGLPLKTHAGICNVAIIAQGGKIVGIVPNQCCDKTVFSECNGIDELLGAPFGSNLVFRINDGALSFSIKFGNAAEFDVQSSLICVLGAIHSEGCTAAKLIKKYEVFSEKAAYCFANAGVYESTADSVCAGNAIIASEGRIRANGKLFSRDNEIISAVVDFDNIESLHKCNGNSGRFVNISIPELEDVLLKPDVNPFPFIPNDRESLYDIFAIQSAGLAKRAEHIHAKRLVIGISGGLDSALALLVCVNALKLLGRSSNDCLAVTMPGFGTTGRTYNNAVELCKSLGVELREISIKEACLKHFADIGHDPQDHNIVYENTQARERTQILFDLANETGGILVGTGDLSEIALGWCTFNGDHISMYSVNCGVPKTLIRPLIRAVAPANAAPYLEDIMATPVSPELLPADSNGKIQQKTEDLIGPYEVHDFYLYHFVKYGSSSEKLLYLARAAFDGKFSESQLRQWLSVFKRRFITQQFKRNCASDGPQTCEISLSCRGSWKMPPDACII